MRTENCSMSEKSYTIESFIFVGMQFCGFLKIKNMIEGIYL